MESSKYPLRSQGSTFATGEADLRDSRGSLIDTDGCIVLSVISGCATATINSGRHPLHRGDFILLFYDSSISIDKSSRTFRVKYLSLAYPLLEEVIYKPLSQNFWDAVYASPVLHPSPRQSALLSAWWQQTEWIADIPDQTYREELIRNHIRSLMIGIDTETRSESIRNRSGHSWTLIVRFYKLLSQHCHEIRNVGFYAGKLAITTTYLNKLCHRHALSSPKQLIDSQTVSEIKSCLINTDMPVKAIAARLHFDDASYLCRYFRRHTRLTPEQYRNNLRHNACCICE